MNEVETKSSFSKWLPIILWAVTAFVGGSLTTNSDRIYDFLTTGQERLEFVESVLEDHESRLSTLEKVPPTSLDFGVER